jgi:hypothetical protein
MFGISHQPQANPANKLHIKCGEEAICKASWRGRQSLGSFLGDWRLVAAHVSQFCAEFRL